LRLRLIAVLEVMAGEISDSLRRCTIHLAMNGVDPLTFIVRQPIGELETIADRLFRFLRSRGTWPRECHGSRVTYLSGFVTVTRGL